jgi:hypothetical protein
MIADTGGGMLVGLRVIEIVDEGSEYAGVLLASGAR